MFWFRVPEYPGMRMTIIRGASEPVPSNQWGGERARPNASSGVGELFAALSGIAGRARCQIFLIGVFCS